MEQIKKHNKDSTKTWKEGVNHLTDRSDEVRCPLFDNKCRNSNDFLDTRRNWLTQGQQKTKKGRCNSFSTIPIFLLPLIGDNKVVELTSNEKKFVDMKCNSKSFHFSSYFLLIVYFTHWNYTFRLVPICIIPCLVLDNLLCTKFFSDQWWMLWRSRTMDDLYCKETQVR